MAFGKFRQTFLPNNHPSYDGNKLLFSATKLPFDSHSDKVVIENFMKREREFEVSVKFSGILDISPLGNLLQKNMTVPADVFQCIEIVLRQAYSDSFITIGRRFFQPPGPRDRFDLGPGSEMYLGGFQGAVQGHMAMFLNVDVAHKGFTKEMALIHVISEMFQNRDRKSMSVEELKQFSPDRWQSERLEKFLKGLKVLYTIPGYPHVKKNYTIRGFGEVPHKQTYLDNESKQRKSVADYYESAYRKKITFPHLPTLKVSTGEIYIPLEFCTLIKGQSIEGKMTDVETRNMIKYAATSTEVRKNNIKRIISTAGYNENKSIGEFGFSVGGGFEEVGARVLNAPKLKYKEGEISPMANGTWRANKAYVFPAKIMAWTVVFVGGKPPDSRLNDSAHNLTKMIFNFGSAKGMQISKPIEPFRHIQGNYRSILEAFQHLPKLDLIIVIVPANTKDIYKLVKQVAELSVGCLTQCIKDFTLSRKLDQSTVENILLKINSKLNGVNHVLANLKLIKEASYMFMGADVTHPSPKSEISTSLAAVTASHNLTGTAYNSHLRIQPPRTEIIADLESITALKLTFFKQHNGKLPDKVFYFRDGVSEGEFDKVIYREAEAIRKGCTRFQSDYKPKLTVLIVQKRHHTRFFPSSKDSYLERDKFENVKPGTCVDTIIVNPNCQNFFLLSHSSVQGVARPTKYTVLIDESGLSNDEFQQLTYYLCHIFVRCNRAVSYPAPTYYAHLGAERAKAYIHGKNINLGHLDQKMVTLKDDIASNSPMHFV